MFEISVSARFSAAHHLHGYDGNCANTHGHNWQVKVFLRGEELDELGFLVDFRRVRKATHNALDTLDHTDLNKVPELDGLNPTSERIARFMHTRLSRALDCAAYRVHCVRVSETQETTAAYWADEHSASPAKP